MEPLVREFNVDIALAGHVHNYVSPSGVLLPSRAAGWELTLSAVLLVSPAPRVVLGSSAVRACEPRRPSPFPSQERYAPLLSDDNKPVAIDFSCLSHNNETYTNAKYPIYVIAGSAGCRENIKPGCGAGGAETLACDYSYGYLQMTVHNGTHISARWLETSAEVEDPATRFHDQAPATVKDQFWIIKE